MRALRGYGSASGMSFVEVSMRRFLSAVFSFLALAAAAVQAAVEEPAGGPPSEPVDVVWVVVFAVVFFGMIGYFFWYVLHHDRKSKTPENRRDR